MNITLPDDLAARLSAGGPDLARQALEAFAAEAYRTGRLTPAVAVGVALLQVAP